MSCLDFDFDGVLKLRLDDSLFHSLVKEFEVWKSEFEKPDLSIERGKVDRKGMYVTSSHYAGDGFYTILHNDGVYRVEENRIVCDGTTSEEFLEGKVAQHRLNQCFTQRDWCIVHASAVSIEGKAVLLPAMGGVGKTNLMLELLSRGARFIGDDHVVIGRNGRFISYPRWVNVLEYNLSMFPGLYERAIPDKTGQRQQKRRLWLYRKARDMEGRNPVTEMVKTRTMAWYYFSHRVKPETLFPGTGLEKSGKISQAFYLRREDNDATVVPSDSERVARLSAASTFPNETDLLHRICSEIAGIPYPSMERRRSIFLDAYRGAKCHEIYMGMSQTKPRLKSIADEIESAVLG
ncbi:MAG: hypothetical protein LUQ14_02535 [Methanomassiliicoccales archaeon]|nr:hypothetical protein [Methanomassiliicoccales archaeon]